MYKIEIFVVVIKKSLSLFIKRLILVALVILGCQSQSKKEVNELYNQAQDFYYKKQYDPALKNLQKFIEKSKRIEENREKILWSIDQIGRIYLREYRDPDATIKFFNSLREDTTFTEAEEDNIQSWLAAAEDWKSIGQFPEMTKDPNKQFNLGKNYFEEGINKLKFPMDKAGNADFAIAQSYLIPFIMYNDNDSRIGEALFMMGEVRRRLWNEKTYWGENFYFKEIIRRFPHSELSWKAYLALEDDTRFGYTGSSGDNTPVSVIEMLERYKKLAESE